MWVCFTLLHILILGRTTLGLCVSRLFLKTQGTCFPDLLCSMDMQAAGFTWTSMGSDTCLLDIPGVSRQVSSTFPSAAGQCAWNPNILHLHRDFTSQGMAQGCPSLGLWASMVTQPMVTNRKVVKLGFARLSSPYQGPQQRTDSRGVIWGPREQCRHYFHARDRIYSLVSM